MLTECASRSSISCAIYIQQIEGVLSNRKACLPNSFQILVQQWCCACIRIPKLGSKQALPNWVLQRELRILIGFVFEVCLLIWYQAGCRCPITLRATKEGPPTTLHRIQPNRTQRNPTPCPVQGSTNYFVSNKSITACSESGLPTLLKASLPSLKEAVPVELGSKLHQPWSTTTETW